MNILKKRILQVFIFLFVFMSLSSPLFAKISLGVAADVSAAWVRPISIEADARLDFNYNLRLRLSVAYDRGNIKDLIMLSPNLDYCIFGKDTGLFVGISPVDICFIISSNKPKVLILNTLSLGIKQSFINNMIFTEFRLLIRDPTTLCKNNFNEIQRYVPEFSHFKFRLCIGFNFDIIKDQNKTNSNTTITKTTTTKIVEKTTPEKTTTKKSTTPKKKSTKSSKNTSDE